MFCFLSKHALLVATRLQLWCDTPVTEFGWGTKGTWPFSLSTLMCPKLWTDAPFICQTKLKPERKDAIFLMTLFFQQICTLENVKIPPMCFSSQKLKGLDAPYIKKNRIGNSPHRRPWILNKRNVYSIQWTTFIVIDVSLPFRHILVNCSIDYRPHVRVWRWFEPWSWRHWKEIRLPIASWTLSTHIHLSRCSTHWNERNIKRNIIKEILLKKKHLPTDETHGVKIVECKSMLFVSYAIYRQYNDTDSILCSSIIKSIGLL